MHELTFGSLFAGIGGFDLGLERAGMRCLWQCEIDPYAVRVLEKHWPDVLRVPDVRDLGADTVPAVDVVAGGFPCQDISYASANVNAPGIAGERSGLWSEMFRIVRELQPRYVVVENVPALLSRGLHVVLGDLAAIGYDAEWDCIPASALGAPHRRDRIWLVGYPNDQGESASPVDAEAPRLPRVVADADGAAGGSARAAGQALLEPGAVERSGRRGGGLSGTAGHVPDPDREPTGWAPIARPERHQWSAEPDVGRVAHGIPARMDRLRCLGNAIVPEVAEWIGRRILEWEGVTL